MGEEFEREQQAFTEAFRAAADAEGFRPLDPDALAAAARPRRVAAGTWAKGLAAAAAVVVAVAGGALVLPRVLGGSAAEPAGMQAVPASGAAGGSSQAESDRAGEDGAVVAGTMAGGVGDPEPGFRWESYRDVAVQVPQSWGYAWAPDVDHCARSSFPTGPYVNLARGPQPTNAILCTERLADADQAMHLTFSPVAGEPPWHEASKVWRTSTRELGSVRLTVTARPADADLADRILASAIVVPGGVDPNGCPVLRPDPDPADLTTLVPSRIGVCLYENAEGEEGALRSSAGLAGERAGEAWDAVLAAPGGGGPDSAAEECTGVPGWPILLVVGDAATPVQVTVGGCAGNGVRDAAAAGGARRLTGALCGALLVDPVRIPSGAGPSARLCLR